MIDDNDFIIKDYYCSKADSAIKYLGCSIEELNKHLEFQFKEVCHYTNLQPLWAKYNLSKGIN